MTRARETARAGFLTEKTFPTGSNVIFRLNDQNLSTNVTIATDKNAMVAGPVSVDSSATLTVNGNLSIV
tara:strand:+ start:1326 stop:1532 length:207 start_codon:yes stop_codon:yes gene_type:complete